MKISQNMMKIGQNMMKFDENQWFWVEKYDFVGEKYHFRGQKIGFYYDFGVKNGIFRKFGKKYFFSKNYFWPGIWFQWSWGAKIAKKAQNHEIWQLIR